MPPLHHLLKILGHPALRSRTHLPMENKALCRRVKMATLVTALRRKRSFGESALYVRGSFLVGPLQSIMLCAYTNCVNRQGEVREKSERALC